MAYVGGVVIVIIGILVSIGLHEVGHMVPAKKFGVRVSQYMIGFGPTIWSRIKGETEYGFKWVLLGGYVRLVGMYPTDEAVGAREPTTWWGRMAADARAGSAEEIAPGEDHRAVYRLSTPKKLTVMLGGPVMNLLVAVVLMGIAMVGIGLPTLTTTVSQVTECVPTGAATCPAGAPASPAKIAGLQPGDEVVSWDGQKVNGWDELSDKIRASSGKVEVVVRRDGHHLTVPVEVAQVSRNSAGEVVAAGSSGAGEPTGYLGIGPTEELVRQPVWDVPVYVGSMAWQVAGIVVQLPQKVWAVGSTTVQGKERSADTVLSIVGLGRIAGEATSVEGEGIQTSDRVWLILNLLVALNVSLFVFNLIPLPPLDGGHIVAALWEGGRRQLSRWRGHDVSTTPADSARLVPIGYAVFIVLAVMGAVLITADFVNPVRLT
ncbi:MAG: site-2 protease family protein [Micrococcales bacterium]|nr:site-2 protease family protein [Micrococcales bacterium]